MPLDPQPPAVSPPPGSRLSMKDRMIDFVVDRLSRPKTHEILMKMPFGRMIARRRARALYDICAGFVYSQVLHFCVALDLFARLKAEPLSDADLARRIGADPERLTPLIRAAISLGLLRRRRDGRLVPDQHGAAVLADPGVSAMVRHHDLFYRDLADPVAFMSGTHPGQMARFWSYSKGATAGDFTDQSAARYSQLMAETQRMVTNQILSAYDFGRHRHVVDVGGGSGAFAESLLTASPNLTLTLFDLPPVAALAEKRFKAAGLQDRATAVAGDFRRLRLPDATDLVTLIRILHDHDDDVALVLLQDIRAAARPGTRLLIAETMASTPGAGPVGDAYFGLYLMAMGQGRVRSSDRIRRMLRRAGYSAIRSHTSDLPLIAQILSARV